MNMQRFFTICVGLCVVGAGWARPAMAQEDTGNETVLSSSSTSTTTTAMVTALGVLVIVTITPKPGRRALQTYLEQNHVAVRDGIHTGAGQSVADLSGAFGVETDEEEAAFGEILRQERATLDAIIEDERVSDDELHQFILTVYEAMRRHDKLEAAAQRIEG